MNATFEYPITSAKRVLVPLNLARDTAQTLLYLQQLAAETPCSVTLFHAIELNAAFSDRMLYPELCTEATAALRKLARFFFGDENAVRTNVRIGRAWQEIISEARSVQSELILLPAPKTYAWLDWLRINTVENVMRHAPCPTLVIPTSWRKGDATHGQPSLPVPVSRAPRLRPTWAGT